MHLRYISNGITVVAKVSRRESRKGLVALTRRKVKPGENGLQLEQTGPVAFELRGPEAANELLRLINALQRRAIAAIENAGKDPERAQEIAGSGDQVDVVHLAAKLMLKLQTIAGLLSRLETSTDLKMAQRLGHEAVLEALRAGSLLYAVGIVENETGIAALAESVEGARRGGRMRGQQTTERNMAMAMEFQTWLERRQATGPSATAMKETIGKRYGLRRSAAVAAIDRGLKLIRRD